LQRLNALLDFAFTVAQLSGYYRAFFGSIYKSQSPILKK
jgi:hypothetical protein